MATPKKKTSKSRKRCRRAAWKAKVWQKAAISYAHAKTLLNSNNATNSSTTSPELAEES